MVSKRRLLRSNRRNFVKSLLGLGASVTAASLFTKDALASIDYDPETEVPRIHGYERVNQEAIRTDGAPPRYEPVYEAISREKWVAVESAHDARQRVSERLSDLDLEPRVAVRWQSRRGRPQRAVVIEHETERAGAGQQRRPDMSFDEFSDLVKDRIPDEVSGTAGRGTDAETTVESIPVEIRQIEGTERQWKYDYEYRSSGVPAGCIIHNGNGHATVGPYMYDSHYNEWIFVTAGHVANNSANGKIYQDDPHNNDYFADVNWAKTKKNGSFDASVLNNLQFGGAWDFAANSRNSYQGPSIDGIQSESGIRDMGINDTIHKQGIATGRSTGGVLSVGPNSIETSCNEDNGDSGGPYWVENSSGGAMLSAIHYKGTDFGFAYGTIMPEIVDEFNLSSL